MYLTAHCANCNAELRRDDRYCRECGQSVEESVAAPITDKRPTAYTSDPATLAYRMPRKRANWTVGLLIAGIVASVISIFVTVSEIGLIDRILAGEFVSDAEIDDNDARVLLVAWLGVAVYAVTVVFFAMWIHRASSNLDPLGAQNQRFSPGWAVGWWFVPIMWLWRPYQVVKEIWLGSDPYYVGGKANQWKEAPVWRWLGWWWAAWILSGVVGWSTFRGFYSAETLEDIKGADQAGIFADVLFIAISVLAVFLVRVISSHQESKYGAVFAANLDVALAGGPVTNPDRTT